MSDNWINEIVYSKEDQKKELLRWIEIIGERKYYEYYLLVRKHFNNNKIQFEELRECAIYDKKISLVLYGIIRDIELQMRHLVLKYISQEEFINKYIKHIGNPKNNKIGIKEKLINNKNSYDIFLQEIDISELVKCVKHLSNINNVFEFKGFNEALDKLTKLRIKIMHQKTLLGKEILSKDNIIAILHLIIDKEYRVKKQKELNSVAVYDNTEVKLYKVLIPESDI